MALLFSTGELQAQRRKNRPGKQPAQVTPENAQDQENANKAQKVAEYEMKHDHHLKNQDKATRKRMKKNLRRAEKHSWGKDVPWYRRWFRKKGFN